MIGDMKIHITFDDDLAAQVTKWIEEDFIAKTVIEEKIDRIWNIVVPKHRRNEFDGLKMSLMEELDL